MTEQPLDTIPLAVVRSERTKQWERNSSLMVGGWDHYIPCTGLCGKKKKGKGYVQDLEINALSFKNQRGLKYQIQATKIRQSPHGMTEPNYTTYRQADRLTDRETDRQTKSQSSRPTGRLTNEERGRETYLRTTHYLLPGRGVRVISRGLYGFQGGQKESVEIDKVWGGEDYGILTANEERKLEYHRALGGIR